MSRFTSKYQIGEVYSCTIEGCTGRFRFGYGLKRRSKHCDECDRLLDCLDDRAAIAAEGLSCAGVSLILAMRPRSWHGVDKPFHGAGLIQRKLCLAADPLVAIRHRPVKRYRPEVSIGFCDPEFALTRLGREVQQILEGKLGKSRRAL